PCPIVRESDGLAMSSRNLRLDACARAKAPLIHQLISSELDDVAVIERLTDAGFRVDYVVTEHGRRFAAARIGEVDNEVRLIDNVAIEGVSP
ncbi:MAG: pantoate--beta-alanine ligase, partial [Pseudomonadales bacterium]|nr:pantoate--beta-alanine ligase [Pseudomonadales bacterium]